jgi:NAD(P)H-dependent flavin oxidoreductase YrpB (nitropropane dioxygenase family)
VAPIPASFDNRVSRDLGVEISIVQAPMGWIEAARTVADIIGDTVTEFAQIVDQLSKPSRLT